MTTTLDLIHRELDESLKRQLYLIESAATIALWRLDDMVDDFSRAQRKRPRTIQAVEERRAWQALYSSYAKTYLSESKVLLSYLRREPAEEGCVTFPVAIDVTETSRPRIRKHLYEPWHFEYFEYGGPARDERTWFEKLRDRFASWNLKRHLRKAGML